MKLLVIYYSFTGNNRVLAEHIAGRVGGDIHPIVERKRRTEATIVLDMMFRRTPKIEALDTSLADYDHVILVAPVWNARVANPMKSLIKRQRESLPDFSFISLCGYERAGQAERLTAQLTALAGKAPAAVAELRVGDLFPLDKRSDVTTISRYKVMPEDLAAFDEPLRKFLAPFASA